MTERKKSRIKIRKDDPVAEQLATPTYRQQVKPSKKKYKRPVQKQDVRGALKEGKDPMSPQPGQRDAGPDKLSLTCNPYSGVQV